MTFSVSMTTIKRWLKRCRETSGGKPRAIPGRPSVKGATLKDWLPPHLEMNPDLTLTKRREAFEEARGGWQLKKVARSFGTRRGGEGRLRRAGGRWIRSAS